VRWPPGIRHRGGGDRCRRDPLGGPPADRPERAGPTYVGLVNLGGYARGEVEAIPAEAWQRRLADLYAKDAGPAVRLVEASDPADIKNASPIHSIPHLPRWHRDRMVVIGDAAHAPTPTSGQGASLAMEDAGHPGPWPRCSGTRSSRSS
jgi:2-polyprenyl-6-methoxyphenol hydroxylase-like FAD-dependent oxidoreductase